MTAPPNSNAAFVTARPLGPAALAFRELASGIAAIDSPEICPPIARDPHHSALLPPPTSDRPSPLSPPPLPRSAMSKKEDSKPVVLKGPNALRSIIAGSMAGAVEIGESRSRAAERARDARR